MYHIREEAQLEELRAALIEGEESSNSGELCMDEILKIARQEAGLSAESTITPGNSIIAINNGIYTQQH